MDVVRAMEEVQTDNNDRPQASARDRLPPASARLRARFARAPARAPATSTNLALNRVCAFPFVRSVLSRSSRAESSHTLSVRPHRGLPRRRSTRRRCMQAGLRERGGGATTPGGLLVTPPQGRWAALVGWARLGDILRLGFPNTTITSRRSSSRISRSSRSSRSRSRSSRLLGGSLRMQARRRRPGRPDSPQASRRRWQSGWRRVASRQQVGAGLQPRRLRAPAERGLAERARHRGLRSLTARMASTIGTRKPT